MQLGLLFQQLLHLVGCDVGAELRVDLVKAQQQLLHWRHGFLDVAEHRLAGVESRLLRQVPDGDAVGWPCLAEKILVLAGHDAQEGGLARAVAPDDADLGARKKRKVDALENFLVGRMNPPQILHSEDVLVSHGARSVLDFAGRPGRRRFVRSVRTFNAYRTRKESKGRNARPQRTQRT